MFGWRINRRMADLERRVRALELMGTLDREDADQRGVAIWNAIARGGKLIRDNALAVLTVATNHAKLAAIVAGEEPDAPSAANDQPPTWH